MTQRSNTETLKNGKNLEAQELMRRADFLRRLASSPLGEVPVCNMLAALEDALLTRDDLTDWIDDALDLETTRALPVKIAGFQAVWNRTTRFHRLGKRCANTNGERIVAFAQQTKLYGALNEQASADPSLPSPPTGGPDNLANYLEEQADAARLLARAHPPTPSPLTEMTVFDPQRLAFFTRRTSDLAEKVEELAAVAAPSLRQELSVAMLRYLGLPLNAGEQWLMLLFSPTATDADCYRPTVFDGVSGEYFKQRPAGPAADLWGRAANLNDLATMVSQLSDGACEAVGSSPRLIDLESCTVFPILPAPDPGDVQLRGLFSKHLRDAVSPSTIDWLGAADALVLHL